MKAMKKTLATLMCLCLLLGCVSVMALAEDTATGSITVQDQSGTNATVAGKTLNLFKIFDATAGTDANGNSTISYDWIVDTVDGVAVNRYEGFFYGETIPVEGSDPVEFPRLVPGTSESSINDVVSYINSLEDKAFDFSQMAASLHKYIHAKEITPDASEKASGTSHTFKDLTLGYYLIYDATKFEEGTPAVRSAAMLAHSGENKVVELKADRPHIEKYVDDDVTDAESWLKGTTASIDDTVDFRLVTAIPDHTLYGTDYTFTITDTMDETLALVDKDAITVTLTPPEGADPITGDHYTVETENIGDATFEIVFSDASSLPAGTAVEVRYSAKVLATANYINVNTAVLTYSNDPNTEGSIGKVSATANVSLWQMTLTKYLEDSTGTPTHMRLSGAEFEIYEVDAEGNETKLHFSDDTTVTREIEGTTGVQYIKYILDASAENTVLKTLDSGENLDDGSADVGKTDGGYLGQILIFGLGEGTYRIREITAPDGYQKPDGYFEFTLEDSVGAAGTIGNASISFVNPSKPGQFTRVSQDSASAKYYVGISNAPGSTLPETGGVGTTLFTVLGIVLMAGAVAFFTSRKRGSMA